MAASRLELAAGIGFGLHRPPVVTVLERCGVVVADDTHGEQLAEDGPLGAEDGVDGLDRDVGLTGDGRDRRGGVAVAGEQRLGRVKDAPAGGQCLPRPPRRLALDGYRHLID